MDQELRTMIDDYFAWMRDKTVLRELDGGWAEITTPNLDHKNDYIQIYVRREGNDYILTDDATTLTELELSGVPMDTTKRRELLNLTLNGFGVRMNARNALEVRASVHTFPMQKHNLLQAMLSLNDMYVLSSSTVTSLFLEDIESWLDLNEVRYSPSVTFTGRSGFTHHFDYLIPKSRRYPERVIRAFNHPNRDAALTMITAWTDTQAARPIDSHAYAILNDTERSIPPTVIEALENYEIRAIPWSQRDQVREELAA